MSHSPTKKEVTALLEVYSLEELLELNDLEIEDLILIAVDVGQLKLPETTPL